MSRELTLTVGDETAGRLDAFLRAALPGLSRRLVRRLVDEGAVRVNGRGAVKGLQVRSGDRVTVPELPDAVLPAPDLALPVVYEDAELVAVDKPGGLPSHALDPRELETAAAFLVARYPELRDVGDRLAPGLVHRLDTGTSGLLLAARTPQAHAAVRMALRARTVDKRYLAVVLGNARALDGRSVALPLAHDSRDPRRMIPASGRGRAWPAETTFAVLAVGAERSLVAATIRTGVTHQVRVHLAHAGHPVVGDTLYGGPSAELPLGRHALHATALVLPHPRDGRRVELVSELPDELRRLIE